MKLRKLLSTLLAAAMLCGLVCTTALAEEGEAAPKTEDTTQTDPADPADTTDPAEPAEGTDPAPADPAEPAEGADPAPADPEPTEPTTPAEPDPSAPVVTVEEIPAEGTAYASTQNITIDGKAVEFQAYALKDENGNLTNYVKLRDIAFALNGSEAQFEVGFDGTISLTTKTAYTVSGTEMTTPFEGDRAYKGGAQTVKVDSKDVAMTAITLTDDDGGAYNYFKLRDLGSVLGFEVGYSNETGISITTAAPAAE